MYSQAHQYVTVRGDYMLGLEQWQFGFRLTSGGVSNQATADALRPILLKWWNGSAAPYDANNQYRATTQVRLAEVKVANIDVDGTYPPSLPSASSFIQPPQAGPLSGLAGQSAQQTMAVTLLTGLPRGLASKGRMYLPLSQWMNVDATGVLPTTAAQAMANSVRILISEINADTVIGNVAVFSRGRGVRVDDPVRHRYRYTFPNPGAMNLVTGVRMGRVIDTQRRRRRTLAEAPTTATGTV